MRIQPTIMVNYTNNQHQKANNPQFGAVEIMSTMIGKERKFLVHVFDSANSPGKYGGAAVILHNMYEVSAHAAQTATDLLTEVGSFVKVPINMRALKESVVEALHQAKQGFPKSMEETITGAEKVVQKELDPDYIPSANSVLFTDL